MDPSQKPEPFMQHALQLASRAAAAQEVPVGAVVVHQGVVVGEGYNQCIALSDPSAHAEILALRSAATRLGNYRLEDCDVYVTLEPCAMCAQAMLHARVRRLFFGAPEPRFGAAGSVLNLFALPALNAGTEVSGGWLAAESRALLQSFFRERRTEQAETRQLPDHAPLREDALRTPDARFAPLQRFASALDAALAPRALRRQHHYRTQLAGLAGLRLHVTEFVPTTPGTAGAGAEPLHLVLHSPDGWWPESALRVLDQPEACQRGHWLLPDLLGMGQSDKPKKAAWHNVLTHLAYLLALLEEATRCNATAGTSPGGALNIWYPPDQEALAFGLSQALEKAGYPSGAPQQPVRVHPLLSVWGTSAPELANLLPPDWRELPFPDRGHDAARRCWNQWPTPKHPH